MKNIKIVLALILILAIVGIATKLGDGGQSLSPPKTVKAVVYYVPVTDYFSDLTNINLEELAGKSIIVRAGDREAVSGLLPGADLVATEEAIRPSSGQIAILPWNEVGPNMKTLSLNDKYLWNKGNFDGYALKAEVEISADEEVPVFDPAKITKINFLGDVMLSRHVNTQMKRLGYDYPWKKVKELTADADITFANLEVPISDRYDVPAAGMSFVAPTKNLDYLKQAGIDVVSVANNHTANFGRQAFLDNLDNLQEAGIKICGGGLTEAEARAGVSTKVGETTFNFLCQSAVVGSLYADGQSAGVPYLGLEPWYRRNQNSLDQLVEDIEKAAPGAVVIDSPHWGVEYKQYPNDDQRAAAQLMIDKGADLIIGTHPHVVQSLEYYHDRFISYSLGNFIFDQEWSTETKQGVMASVYFYGDRNVAVNLIPLQIENYAQPAFVTGPTAAKIIGDIRKNTVGF
jgi:poly-gamma-glutamate synthesis protein (capsule biosynthesis protein)